MVREVEGKDDNTGARAMDMVRTQGKGRVFYTASGHDERVWKQPAFHQLLKAGIIWSVGDERKQSYEQFIAERAPLKYEKRGDIANYENRPEPLPYQFPLKAEDSMKYTRAPVGFRSSCSPVSRTSSTPLVLPGTNVVGYGPPRRLITRTR